MGSKHLNGAEVPLIMHGRHERSTEYMEQITQSFV